MLISTADLFILSKELPKESFDTWGWRSPFVIGILLGITGTLLRRLVDETPVFEHLKETGNVLKQPLLTAFKRYKSVLIQGVGICVFDAVGCSIILIYPSSYFIQVFGFSLSTAFAIGSFTLLAAVIALPFAGRCVPVYSLFIWRICRQ